jgi:hypothetical protein
MGGETQLQASSYSYRGAAKQNLRTGVTACTRVRYQFLNT